jgi:hypothetical protein
MGTDAAGDEIENLKFHIAEAEWLKCNDLHRKLEKESSKMRLCMGIAAYLFGGLKKKGSASSRRQLHADSPPLPLEERGELFSSVHNCSPLPAFWENFSTDSTMECGIRRGR